MIKRIFILIAVFVLIAGSAGAEDFLDILSRMSTPEKDVTTEAWLNGYQTGVRVGHRSTINTVVSHGSIDDTTVNQISNSYNTYIETLNAIDPRHFSRAAEIYIHRNRHRQMHQQYLFESVMRQMINEHTVRHNQTW